MWEKMMLSQAFLVAVVAAACYYVHQFLDTKGVNGKYYKHHPGVCRRVPGVQFGSEDIHVIADGKAFISSGLLLSHGMKEYTEKHKLTGGMFLFDFKNSSVGAVELRIRADKPGFDVNKFRPHGLSVLEDKTKGEHLVYVINHPVGLPDVVEKFRYSPTSRELIHLRSIPVGDKLQMSNDLALVAEDQFYIANFGVFKLGILKEMERLFPFRLAGVFFYNGIDMEEVIPRFSMPNGVLLSPDNRMLYVVSYVERTVAVYRIDPATKGVQLLQTVQLYGMGDNLHLSQPGDALLVATHPDYFRFRKYIHSPTPWDHISPSSVVRLPLDKDNLIRENDVTELFYDHGDLITGSSVAAIFDGQMLIGSVLDSLVHCDLDRKVKN